jgi:predicted transcriptional regulator
MAKHTVPRPTDAELAILRILWKRGPSTVRQVYEIAATDRALAYTTTLKLLQIMTDKGLTLRREEGRGHVYAASHKEEEMQRRLVDDLLDRAFGGSAAKLVLQALDTLPASAQEREEIRRLIDEKSPKENDRA